MKLEKQKIDIITPYLTFDVPQYTIVDDKFIVYPLIEGKTLDDVDN